MVKRWRIRELADTNSNGVTSTATGDVIFRFVYDDAWRRVATYRESDANPKEIFVYHNAGLGGWGASMYGDSVILRDKDANGGGGWTSAADSTREERLYYVQNWRGDVISTLTSDGKLFERYRYSPYGVPFGMPCGDLDADGDVDAGDASLLALLVAGSIYAENADLDLNDVVDEDDEARLALFDGSALGWNALSLAAKTVISGGGGSGGTRLGYAAYQWDPYAAKWHVRHRVLDSERGRWLQRPPDESTVGYGLYGYVRLSPICLSDSSGQPNLDPPNSFGSSCADGIGGCPPFSMPDPYSHAHVLRCMPCREVDLNPTADRPGRRGGGAGGGGGGGGRGGPEDLDAPPPQPGCTRPEPNDIADDAACCEAASPCRGRSNAGVVCCGGRVVLCVWRVHFGPGVDQARIQRECMLEHEETHRDDVDCSTCPAGRVCRGDFRRGLSLNEEECDAYNRQVRCLLRRINECPHGECRDDVREAIRRVCGQVHSFCDQQQRYQPLPDCEQYRRNRRPLIPSRPAVMEEL